MRAYLDQQLLLGNDDTQECVSVYDLFKDYMDANLDTLGNGYQRTVQDHPLNSPQLTAHVNGLQENDVLFVKVPSIASYHYLTLICQGGYLMIFQKFGSYGRIYLTQTTAAIFSQIYNEYFALIAQYRASNTVLGKVENLTDGQVENMTHAFEHMYVLYGVNDLEYYVISRSRRIQRWLLKDRILPFSSYDSGKVISNIPGESLLNTPSSGSSEDYYQATMESQAKLACNTDLDQFVYSKYTYNIAPAGAMAGHIIIPPRRNRVNLGRVAGVGPRKKFNALRMFKQFAKQHSSEIQSSIQKSSSAKFQTKKRKAPRTKKTKRRRK